MNSPTRDPNTPTLRGPATGLSTDSDTGASSDQSTIDRLIRDGIMVGLILAGLGFVFVGMYTLTGMIWGTYFGADPGFGQALSAAVMTTGIAIATLLWLGREVGSVVASKVDESRSD